MESTHSHVIALKGSSVPCVKVSLGTIHDITDAYHSLAIQTNVIKVRFEGQNSLVTLIPGNQRKKTKKTSCFLLIIKVLIKTQFLF